jgi:hypothetical protein
MALQLIDGSQRACWGFEIHKAVTFTSVGGFIKNGLSRNDRTKSRQNKKTLLPVLHLDISE